MGIIVINYHSLQNSKHWNKHNIKWSVRRTKHKYRISKETIRSYDTAQKLYRASEGQSITMCQTNPNWNLKHMQ